MDIDTNPVSKTDVASSLKAVTRDFQLWPIKTFHIEAILSLTGQRLLNTIDAERVIGSARMPVGFASNVCVYGCALPVRAIRAFAQHEGG
jgi:hypothetical protein